MEIVPLEILKEVIEVTAMKIPDSNLTVRILENRLGKKWLCFGDPSSFETKIDIDECINVEIAAPFSIWLYTETFKMRLSKKALVKLWKFFDENIIGYHIHDRIGPF